MNRDFIGNIRKFQTQNFSVSVDAEYDWDTDLSFDDSGEVQRKLESGDLISFQVAVTVTHNETGLELGADYLCGCIYESIEAFQDHREAAKHTRRLVRRNGRFQIYRKDRKYPSCLTRADKLRKRGFATRERAEQWARDNVKVSWEVFEYGICGSYFADMIHTAITEARKNYRKYTAQLAETRLRTSGNEVVSVA
jgi:hypothetical protein